MATPRPSIIPDPIETPADLIRDRIASRSQRMDQRYPAALDLEAAVVAGMHQALHGVAALTAGTHCPEHWREALRGERPMHLGDVCRLATEPGTEGRAAALAVVHVLARALGQSVEPADGRPRRGLATEAAEVSSSAAYLTLSVASALEDGRVDESERASCLGAIAAVKRELADVEELLSRASR
jgi:hypothetical protein